MHGEYKVPDGKLVKVDAAVTDGRLTDVRVSGDFFLEPDETLEQLNRSLTGAGADEELSQLVARMRAELPSDARLVGFSLEAVAIAVRRGVTQASQWTDHRWGVVHEAARSPLMHMALDQVLAEEVAAGRRAPTLRIWEWTGSAVILGSFQSVGNEVDLEAAERYGIEVVRRITGGGAMFTEPGNAVTYSLYAPVSLVAGMPFAESYAFLDDWVLQVLRELGLNVWYEPLNDISSDGGKIGGAAQRRVSSGAVLHHATMSYDVDADKLADVLRVGGEKLSDKGVASAKKRVDPLRRQTGLDRAVIIERLVDGFRSRYGLSDTPVTADEEERARELIEAKFATDGWFYRVP